MEDWNAGLYNRYSEERMQPVTDLISRLNKIPEIKRIIDIGCGTGISTLPLHRQWPGAEILGVDNSDSMLSSAKQTGANIQWIKRDCNASLEDLGKFDLVFSNAVLQWLPDQEAVIRNLGKLLTQKGILAVQIPKFTQMTVYRCIQEAAKTLVGFDFAGLEKESFRCYDPYYYYDVLSRHYSRVEIWQTNYFHIMNSHEDILNFFRSTGLRPYLNRLKEEEQKSFLAEVLKEIKLQYPIQRDGKVLFEFPRIFFFAGDYKE